MVSIVVAPSSPRSVLPSSLGAPPLSTSAAALTVGSGNYRSAVAQLTTAICTVRLAHVHPGLGPADREGLERWLDLLVQAKRRKALDDPELFATSS
jgi:hypothetical protein